MRAYRETFRRHRMLYLLPPLIAALGFGAYGFKAPKSYVSTASLWIDNQASSTSSLNVGPGNVQAETPASAEQTVLNELLPTSKFDSAVVAGAAVGSAGGSANSLLVASIATGVTSALPGPQVLQLTYTGSSPAVAHDIVKSLVAQLQTFSQQFGRAFGRAAVAYDQTQEAAAAQAVAGAKAALNTYQSAHPRATSQTDQTYASLVAALATATSSLNSSTNAVNQAQAQARGSAGGTTVTVLDQPSFESAPLSGLKGIAVKALAAGVVGLLLSLLAIVALTPGGRDAWDGEMSGRGSDSDSTTARRIRVTAGGGGPTERSGSLRTVPVAREARHLPRPADDRQPPRQNQVGGSTDQPARAGRA